MCTDGVGHLVLGDEAIQEKMANPILDLVHKQVVMTLYSLDASHRLDEYKEVLPLYLSVDWPQCNAILDAIEQAGLINRTENGIAMTHPVESDSESSCGCSM
jgi:predicted methyltransferase